ncbi:MAG: PAS domain S-box protein, partial [Cyanobacteria bacterium J083]
MQKSSPLPLVNWQGIIEQKTVKVPPHTKLTDAITLMNQENSSCVLIEAQGQLQGIFTERDLVRLIAAAQDFLGIADTEIAEVMTREPFTIYNLEKFNLIELISLLTKHSIRHLPLLDAKKKSIGVITYRSLRNALKGGYLLQHRQVKDLINQQVVQISGDRNIIDVANLLATHQVSCVVVVERNSVPVGIITERDIVQFGALQLNFSKTLVKEVMSTPLLPLSVDASLWEAHQLMQKHHIRRLVVVQGDGTLAGIISQERILQSLDLDNVFDCIATLESLLEEKTQQLEKIQIELENEIKTANQFLNQQIKEYFAQNSSLETDQKKTAWLDKINQKIFGFLYQQKLPLWTGALIASGLALGIEMLRRWGVIVPVSFMLLIIVITLSASLGGVVAGLWSSLVWALFVIYAATVPFGPTTLTGGAGQVTIGIMLMTIVAIVQGLTKEENRRLIQKLRRLNHNLDQAVKYNREELLIINSSLNREIRDRLSVETQLRESETRYRTIFEQAPVGIVRTGLDKKLLSVNPKFSQMVGYDVAQLQQLTFPEITHPADTPSDTIHIHQLLTGEITTLVKEKRYIHKNGSIVWVNLTVTLVRDDNNQPAYFVAVIENITQRKQTELALQASEERFKNIINSFPFPVWLADETGLCTFFNQAWLDFTGKNLVQELGYGWLEGVHPQERQACLDNYQSALAKRKNFSLEYRLRKGDGKYSWVLDQAKPRFRSDGSLAGYVGACLDISDRVSARKERENLLAKIAQKNHFLETILQQMPAGVLIAKAPEGEIILKNQQAEATLRHPLAKITKVSDYEQYMGLHPNGQVFAFEDYPLVKALRQGQVIKEEIDYLCGDGIIRSLLVHATPIFTQERQIIAAVVTFYDVSELKKAQALKKEAQHKALMLKEIHHRIKNNLQIISALLDLQSEQMTDPSMLNLLEESQARIQTIALIHEKLYNSGNL